RDHDADPGTHERGKLVAKRFAAASRHQHEHVAAFERGRDRLLLPAAKRVVAEDLAKEPPCFVERRHRGGARDGHDRVMMPQGARTLRASELDAESDLEALDAVPE